MANSGDMPFQPAFVTFGVLKMTLGRQMVLSTAAVALFFYVVAGFTL